MTLREVIDKDFESFKKSIKNLIPLYHCTTKEAAQGIIENGPSAEFTGKNSNFYGRGFYTTFTLRSAVRNTENIYGTYIIKFGLSGGFKDFLFFDEEMNKKYNGNEPIESQIKRLCPPEVIRELDKKGFFDVLKRRAYGRHSRFDIPLSSDKAREFYLDLRGEKLSDDEVPPYVLKRGNVGGFYDELLISKTKVRGYIFVGGNDGEVCVVRDFNSLVPIAVFNPEKGKNPLNPDDEGWEYVLNNNNFDKAANQIDIATHIRGKYPQTPLSTKTICGYVMVKGRPSGKYNYVNVKTMQELLPKPADFAVDFNPDNCRAKFIIDGNEYEYSAKNHLFIEDGVFTYTPDEFAEELNNTNNDE